MAVVIGQLANYFGKVMVVTWQSHCDIITSFATAIPIHYSVSSLIILVDNFVMNYSPTLMTSVWMDPCRNHMNHMEIFLQLFAQRKLGIHDGFSPNQASAFLCGFPMGKSASWLMAQISQSCHSKRRHLGLVVTYCNKIFMIVFWQRKTLLFARAVATSVLHRVHLLPSW